MIAGCAAFWGLYWIPLRETEALGVPPLWSVALFNLPLFLISGLIFAWFFSRNRQILGTVMLADTISTENPKWAAALYAQAPKLGHAYAARQLTHHLANPPGETEVITKGGFGEDQ